MRSLARILLPVDFSERSQGAARCARMLAARFHSQVTLLHVLPPPAYEFGALEIGGSMLDDLYVCRTTQAENELKTFLADELAGLDVRRLVLEGDPARRIVEFARDEQVGVIVMPTHGYGQFRHFILGSITAKVLHDADCPVWTGVHLENAPPACGMALRRVACAVDLGPQSLNALQWAAGICREFEAKLDIVHVATCAQAAAGVGAGAGTGANWRSELESRIREELARLRQQAAVEDAGVVVQPGDPPKVVCAEAARLQADLLVIGRGSAGGRFGRLRANAYAIIRQSPCPVASV